MTTRTYAAGMGWLTSERTVRGTAVIQDRSYTRTNGGRLSSVSSPFAGESWDYGYDARQRLVSATHVGSPADDQAFTYDTLGRLTFNSRLGEYTYGTAQPHAVRTAGANAYTYDANGNMLSGGGRTMRWNAENRLAQVWSAEGTATFGYDGDGRRVVMSDGAGVHHFVGDDYEVRDVNVPGQTEVTKYLSLGGVLVARKVGNELRWVHTDHQGSTNVETDAGGAVV
ncbi:MAG: hypothetical protein GWN73_30260, partial [Actinobacteria bacterium]|nr:hypothetical protein [Actinomycetota bacterium]NIS34685.1 hypothetical protein [Actinomycetota bacterium]NIU69445.1 hypothetical protein [Actinomycetota bacterium]NIW31310.1 hypothetical protein [Actinomycetota bacterium]